eukprot:jgi/Botrbrau1/10445/Bobra.0133s0052.1
MALLRGARGADGRESGPRVVTALRGGTSKRGGRGGVVAEMEGGTQVEDRVVVAFGELRGRGRSFGRSEKKKTKEELDAEMDAYFLKDSKTAQTKLDADLDEYFASKDKAKAASAAGTADVATAEGS